MAAALFVISCSSPNLRHAVLSATDAAQPDFQRQRALAAGAHDAVLRHHRVSTDQALQQCLTVIAQELGRVSGGDAALRYDVTLLDDETAMIFSAGDGRIFVTTELVRVLPHAGTMAFALGHEIAHINRGDLLRALEEDSATPLDADAVGARAIARSHIGYAAHIEGLADRLALDYMEKAGYDRNHGMAAISAIRDYQRRVARGQSLLHANEDLMNNRARAMDQMMPRRSWFRRSKNPTPLQERCPNIRLLMPQPA